MKFIPVCEPFLNGNELSYVTDCVSTGWISSSGKYVKEFEEKFANYCGVKYGVTACNGTAALHLALLATSIGKGDEVIVPNFTMIASAFSICYTGAIPIFVDADLFTWNIDINRIEEKITSRTKAIMSVSIFGNVCEMDKVSEIAKKYNLLVIDDAAESHGAEYNGKKTGSLADITAFSFFANKNLTTGEGGMVVTNNKNFYDRVKYFKNLCFSLDGPRNYIHNDIGFNYRMSNIHAAIGLAQLEKADYYRNLRIGNAELYKKYLAEIEGIVLQKTNVGILNVHWMNGIIVNPKIYGKTRDELIAELKTNGVETRTFFVGMNKQPSLLKYGCVQEGSYPVTDYLSENGFYLPSSSNLKEEDIIFICKIIRDFRSK
ncbi:MAG: DegT/DnrJ/EryC1/StrS family aminotransferase [Bacteroidota bacterium]|nr:DegT/DnrJ/EryC1/StrS family aminotransferase [Bacteroidota bacterium]